MKLKVIVGDKEVSTTIKETSTENLEKFITTVVKQCKDEHNTGTK